MTPIDLNMINHRINCLDGVRLGIREIRLESTATARQFYSERGFSSHGEPSLAFGRVKSYPMWKRLAP